MFRLPKSSSATPLQSNVLLCYIMNVLSVQRSDPKVILMSHVFAHLSK